MGPSSRCSGFKHKSPKLVEDCCSSDQEAPRLCHGPMALVPFLGGSRTGRENPSQGLLPPSLLRPLSAGDTAPSGLGPAIASGWRAGAGGHRRCPSQASSGAGAQDGGGGRRGGIGGHSPPAPFRDEAAPPGEGPRGRRQAAAARPER